MATTFDRILGLIRSAAGTLLGGSSQRQKPAAPQRRGKAPAPRTTSSVPGTVPLARPYPGDFRGKSTVRYAPKPDGKPDPGEIVWTWVPYEEDYGRGKDRPVLLVGRSGTRLLALMLTSKDHLDDLVGDADYVEIGPGPWDRQRRPSEVRLDRVLQVDPRDIRREGAVLDVRRFGAVASGLRSRHGWS